MLDYPTLVRIEYWDPETFEWYTGHAGINLMNPQKYVTALGKRGVIARAIDVDLWRDNETVGEAIAYSEGADLL